MINYNSIAKDVEPKKQKLRGAEERLESTMASLAVVKARLAEVMERIDALEAKYTEAASRKEELTNEGELTI
jgi:dynein heavy chain